MTASITYTGQLRTEAIHLRSGSKIITDAPIDNEGKGEAFSPTDLMATSLVSCILTIMGIAARKHQINIDGTSAALKKVMTSSPRRIARLEINIQMPNRGYSQEEKNIIEEAAHSCPVCLSVNPDIEEIIDIKW